MPLPNPFAKSLGGSKKSSDMIKAVRASAAKKVEAAKEESKKALAKARSASHALAVKAKEPVLGVMHDEGVRMLGHAGGYAADRFIPFRGAPSGFLNVLVRPSAITAGLAFLGAVVTTGETRFYLRSVGQGNLHQVQAVALRAIDRALGDKDAERAMGEGGEDEPTDADV